MRFSDRARAQLQAADWPGNVRELANVVSRGVLRASAGRRTRETVVIEPMHLDVHAAANSEMGTTPDKSMHRRAVRLSMKAR